MRQPNLPLEPKKPLPSVTLLSGDCLDVMPTLLEKSIALCFADLPYGSPHRKTTDCAWDQQIDLKIWWQEINRVVSGAIVMTAVQPFASFLVASNVRMFRHDIIWHKTNVGGWFNANRAPLRAHEHVLVFSENSTKYFPQKTPGKPYVSKNRSHAKAFVARNLAGNTVRTDTVNKDGKRFPISVQKFNRCTEKIIHPTQKPIALLEWLVLTYTHQGDTVLDPVMGSGTTGVACLRTGRHFVGIEKDAGYFEAASKRINAERERLEAM